jgi:hypothetical protein
VILLLLIKLSVVYLHAEHSLTTTLSASRPLALVELIRLAGFLSLARRTPDGFGNSKQIVPNK